MAAGEVQCWYCGDADSEIVVDAENEVDWDADIASHEATRPVVGSCAAELRILDEEEVVLEKTTVVDVDHRAGEFVDVGLVADADVEVEVAFQNDGVVEFQLPGRERSVELVGTIHLVQAVVPVAAPVVECPQECCAGTVFPDVGVAATMIVLASHICPGGVFERVYRNRLKRNHFDEFVSSIVEFALCLIELLL